MSSNIPFDPAPEPEFLGQGGPVEAPTSRKKLYVLAGIGVLAAGAIGVGAWGVAQLAGGGPGAAAVLPDTALGYASIDLDPSAGQKIQAIKTLKKFPALADKLSLGAKDDLRSFLVDQITSDGECKGLSYDSDIKPWLGEKAAIAAVPNKDHVADPVFAIQVTDEGKAKAGIATIFRKCDNSEHYGLAFNGGYAILAETKDIATTTVADAKKGTLADSPDYKAAMASVGDLGPVSVYVSKNGPQAILKGFSGAFLGKFCDTTGDGALDPTALEQMGKACDAASGKTDSEVEKAMKTFKGVAGTVRFSDGGIEVAFAAKGGKTGDAPAPLTLTKLPGSTVAAAGFTLPKASFSAMLGGLRMGAGAQMYDQMVSELKQQTGVDLPVDLEKLFSHGVVFALDGKTDFSSLIPPGDPSGLKAGIRLGADEADVRRVVDGLLKMAGGAGSDVVKIKSSGGHVALGFDEGYLGELLADGDLGSNKRFVKAVAEPDKSSAALFVDFDGADNWLDKLVSDSGVGDRQVVDNVKPLEAFGLSAWVDGDESHFVARLSTN